MSFSALAVAVIAAAPGPLALVKQADADVRKVLATDATIERLAVTSEAYVDFVELARRALGKKEWERLDRRKQDDFSATMKGLLRASYAQKALGDSKNGATFEFSREDVQGNEATVTSTLVVKSERYPVTYRLYRADAKSAWRIYDVVTDDVSLVSTYADQFRKMIANKGFDGLLASLKAKKAQLERGPAAEAGSAGTAGR